MKDLLKVRGLISVNVTRLADGDEELDYSVDLQEYETLCTALEVLEQLKVLQAQPPTRSVAIKSTLVKGGKTRRQRRESALVQKSDRCLIESWFSK